MARRRTETIPLAEKSPPAPRAGTPAPAVRIKIGDRLAYYRRDWPQNEHPRVAQVLRFSDVEQNFLHVVVFGDPVFDAGYGGACTWGGVMNPETGDVPLFRTYDDAPMNCGEFCTLDEMGHADIRFQSPSRPEDDDHGDHFDANQDDDDEPDS